MDPQVKQPQSGKCPICGMDLIKVKKGETPTSDVDPNAVMFSDEAMALANVETIIVGASSGDKEIRLFGKIEPDQRLQQSQSAYVGGRIERLCINAVGDVVSKGQTLAVIYSPELYTAEQELVSALGTGQSVLVEAAVEKLRLLNIPQAQIDEAGIHGLDGGEDGGVFQLGRHVLGDQDRGLMGGLGGGHRPVALEFAQVGTVGHRHLAAGRVVARGGKGVRDGQGQFVDQFFHRNCSFAG